MLTRSETWQELAADESILIETRITTNGVTYEDVLAPAVTRALMSDSVSIGNAVAAMCTFSLDSSIVLPRSAELLLEMRLTTNGDEPTVSEWLPVGTFYVSRRTKDPINGIVAFESYDAMLKANASWDTTGLTFPVAMNVAATHIATLIGLEIDERTEIATGANYTVDEPTDGTLMRDVLATIAGYNGGNWVVTPENKLRLVPLIDAADAAEAEENVLDVTAAIGEVIAENMGTITGIRCNYGDDLNFLVGDDTGVVVDANVPAVIATELGETLIGKSYQMFVLNDAFYDPAVELGDYIRYYDNISSVVYAETITFEGAAQGVLSAPDSQEIADEYPYYGQTPKTLAVAKAYAEQATQELSESLTQQEVFNRLTRGGEEQGLILVNGRLYVNASYINTGEFDAAKARIKNLSVEDIESGIIHSSDYQTVVVPMVYPSNTLYPANDTYPSNGESVTTGFAIDFETGQILGGLYSTETERLQEEIDNISPQSIGLGNVNNSLILTASTGAAMYTQLNALPVTPSNGAGVTCYIGNAALKLLTGKSALTSVLHGVITRINSTRFRVFGMYGDTGYVMYWALDITSAGAITPMTVYRLQGTEL